MAMTSATTGSGIVNLGAGTQEVDECVVRIMNLLVEVAGIEPASVGFSMNILRAQPTGSFRESTCRWRLIDSLVH